MSAADVVRLDAVEISKRLPHRHPFLLLDRVDELVPGVSAVGIKNISIADPVFAGHFPGNPIYPGVQMVEVAAQLCGLVISSDGDGPVLGYLASIKRFKFSALVVPGDRLTIRTRAGVSIGSLTEFTTELTVDGKSVASGTLAIARAMG